MDADGIKWGDKCESALLLSPARPRAERKLQAQTLSGFFPQWESDITPPISLTASGRSTGHPNGNPWSSAVTRTHTLTHTHTLANTLPHFHHLQPSVLLLAAQKHFPMTQFRPTLCPFHLFCFVCSLQQCQIVLQNL